ncbi:MAG TPA: Tat pathway signal sequence domain protein, partial [Streptomyces sp.]
MYEKLRRHLGKVVAGTALAVTGTAVMVAITLPGAAGADDAGGRATGSAQSDGAAGEKGPQGAPEPGRLAGVPPAG